MAPWKHTEICGKRFSAESDVRLAAGGFVYPDLKVVGIILKGSIDKMIFL